MVGTQGLHTAAGLLHDGLRLLNQSLIVTLDLEAVIHLRVVLSLKEFKRITYQNGKVKQNKNCKKYG